NGIKDTSLDGRGGEGIDMDSSALVRWKCIGTTAITLLVLLWTVGFPATAFGQAAVAGVVTDATGAAMRGATVEAASLALIEKARAAVTNDSGQYRIEDLRPGIYTVTFTLTGWRPYVREGIVLAGSFTATVNAQLTIGPLTETITVTGEIPIVDVHSINSEM